MDRERFLELDRSGKGLTDEEWEQGYHWCYEWDSMLVGPGQEEALVCSCNHPKIEEWKKSEEAQAMLKEQEERMNHISEEDVYTGDDPLEYFANLSSGITGDVPPK